MGEQPAIAPESADPDALAGNLFMRLTASSIVSTAAVLLPSLADQVRCRAQAAGVEALQGVRN
jgi:hypothetical protein